MKIAYVSDSVGSPLSARGIFHNSVGLIKLLSEQGHQVDLVVQKPKTVMNKEFILLGKKYDVRDIIRTSIILDYLLDVQKPGRFYRLRKILHILKQKLTLITFHQLRLLIPGYVENPTVVINKSDALSYVPVSHQFMKHVSHFLLSDIIYNINVSLPSPKINLGAYDLILIDTPHYVEVKKKSDAPIVNVIHDLIPLADPCLHTTQRLIFSKKMNKMLNISDKIIFVSKTTQQIFEKYFSDRKPSTIIYPIFEPAVSLNELPTYTPVTSPTLAPIKISTVVSDEYRKNVQALIEAHSLLPNHYHLDIIGKVEPRQYKVAAAQKERVKFVGYVSNTTKVNLLYTSDVVCFPSLAEGFGIPVIEGLYYTGRVVCSDIPVFREIAEGYAQFCDPLSAWDIANKILYACSLPKLDHSTRELAVSPFRSAAQSATLESFIR